MTIKKKSTRVVGSGKHCFIHDNDSNKPLHQTPMLFSDAKLLCNQFNNMNVSLYKSAKHCANVLRQAPDTGGV